MRVLCFLILLLVKTVLGQNIGLTVYNGLNFSALNMSKNTSIDYKSNSNNDLRVGVVFGDQEGYSASILLSKLNVINAHTSEILTTKLALGYTVMDFQVRKTTNSKIFKSVALGPTVYLLNFADQRNNNLVVRNSRSLNKTIFGVNSQIDFKSWHLAQQIKCIPYIYYRVNLSNLESDTEGADVLRLTTFGIGINTTLLWI